MLGRYSDHPVVRQTFDEASKILGEDLWTLVEQGPAEALALTTNTQPVMLAADVAVWRAWQSAGGPKPVAVAGHSLGEYAALVAAGALSFADALPLVRFRAQVMQEAVPAGVGAMAVVMGGSDDGVRAACAEGAQGQVVEAVNFNAPGQVVIAGHKEAVERTMGLVKSHGAKRAVILPVSAPFHSTLLKPAAEKLAARLRDVPFGVPDIPVIHNVDVAEHRSPDEIRAALAAQAAQPVRWTETVRALASRGVSTLVECGPGTVLTNLARRIDEALKALPLADDTDIGLALDALNKADT
jgi:[acyl-carrier-protein] S-malonyltransferase